MCKLAQERGYDEINLNVGCPSDRVQNGRFGACLMGEAQSADCVKAMRDVVDSCDGKTRIGIDNQMISIYVILLITVSRIITAIPLLFMLAKLGYRD